MADLVNAEIDASFNTKQKFLDKDDEEVIKRFEDVTYTRKGKGKINRFKPWLNYAENNFQEDINLSSGISILRRIEITSAPELSQSSANASFSVTDMDEVSVLSIQNNVSACFENATSEFATIDEANMLILEESYVDDRILEFGDSRESDIWTPQFGSASNPLTSRTSPLTNVLDAMHFARQIVTPADKIHINLKSVPDRYQEMISTIVKAAMLGISLEDNFKRMEQMESTLKVVDESIETLKHEKASMEEKHNISKKLLESELHQTRQQIEDQNKRADCAEVFVNSQKELYQKAFENAIYFQTENAALTKELSIRDDTLTRKNKEINDLTNELEEKKISLIR